MKNNNNKIAILVSIIFALLSALSIYTDTVIFDIALPLTIIGVVISYDPRSIAIILIIVASSTGFKLPYDKNDGILYLGILIVASVAISNVTEPIFEKYKIHGGIGYITVISIYLYLILSSVGYLPTIVKSLHSVL